MKKIVVWVVAVMLALQIANFAIAQPRWEERLVNRLRLFYVFSTIINLVLLLALLLIYINSFLKTKSSFMLGLVFFIGVLLVQRFLSFYFPSMPHLFETLALIILLILSLE
ncbi:MAG: hypothetical protein H5T45_02810 [Thermoplasmatales archaeon]|nr:hypothetical protein [Thermoplasmatales archaeon]